MFQKMETQSTSPSQITMETPINVTGIEAPPQQKVNIYEAGGGNWTN